MLQGRQVNAAIYIGVFKSSPFEDHFEDQTMFSHCLHPTGSSVEAVDY